MLPVSSPSNENIFQYDGSIIINQFSQARMNSFWELIVLQWWKRKKEWHWRNSDDNHSCVLEKINCLHWKYSIEQKSYNYATSARNEEAIFVTFQCESVNMNVRKCMLSWIDWPASSRELSGQQHFYVEFWAWLSLWSTLHSSYSPTIHSSSPRSVACMLMRTCWWIVTLIRCKSPLFYRLAIQKIFNIIKSEYFVP